jgi:glutaredoxin
MSSVPITKHRVVVYSKVDCPWCVKAKDYLNQHNVKYEEIIISKNDLKDFKVKCPDKKTVPQILFEDKMIGGYTDLIQSNLVHDYHSSKLTE